MTHKKRFNFITILFVIGLLTACGTGTKSNESLVERKEDDSVIENLFSTSLNTKEQNGEIIISYDVRNVSGEAQELTFPTGLQADFILYDENGKKLKQFSDEVMSIQVIQILTVEKEMELHYEFQLSDLVKGHYKIEVFLTAKEEEAKVTKDINVKGQSEE